MHIEPGYIVQSKIMLANVTASGLLLGYARELIKRPGDIIRTVLASVFFTLFMQSFHYTIGPSELHFVGAMAMYLTLGFIPTLIGFAGGLLLQGLVFSPWDLPQLAVNSLSLILPLLTVHYTIGRNLREQGASLNWRQIVKMDVMYYSGVTIMVGFWLLMSDVTTPFAAWAAFASSYVLLVIVEPVVTYTAVRLLKHYEQHNWVKQCFAVAELKLAK